MAGNMGMNIPVQMNGMSTQAGYSTVPPYYSNLSDYSSSLSSTTPMNPSGLSAYEHEMASSSLPQAAMPNSSREFLNSPYHQHVLYRGNVSVKFCLLFKGLYSCSIM